MKASDLAISLINRMKEYGDFDVKVNLLTENQSNYVDITGSWFDGFYEIECDIDDLKEFKKNLK